MGMKLTYDDGWKIIKDVAKSEVNELLDSIANEEKQIYARQIDEIVENIKNDRPNSTLLKNLVSILENRLLELKERRK